MKALIKYIVFVLLILQFTHCNKVKYPENSGKISHPEKIDLMRGFITAYNVNGIDSLDLLNNYLTASPQDRKKVQTIDFQTKFEWDRRYVSNSDFGEIIYEWNSQYKYIYITHYPDTNIIKRNIFLTNGANWEILKLIKSKTTVNNLLKIKAEINGNVYEIQFN